MDDRRGKHNKVGVKNTADNNRGKHRRQSRTNHLALTSGWMIGENIIKWG
jgi:hypothetical protein